MPFQKGQSGNPAGRPRGSRNRASALVHDLLEGEAEDLARKVIAMAKEGDLGAMRLCMDRIAPSRKYDPACCELPYLECAEDSVLAMRRIAEGVATGTLVPAEAVALAKVVEIYVQALEAHDFEKRLNKLEREPVSKPAQEPEEHIELHPGSMPEVAKSL